MKKYLLSFIFLFWCLTVFAQRTVMDNYYGYSYSSARTLSNLSFQNVEYGNFSYNAAIHTYSFAGNFIFNNVGIINNKAGIYVSEGILTFQDSEIRNNSKGGIIISNYSNNGIALLNNVTFSGNTASTSGGAIYSLVDVYRSAKFGSFNNVNFINNTAGTNGGALYLSHKSQNMNNVIFRGNSAVNGGAVYAVNDFTLSGGNIFFYNNTATNGGAIYGEKNIILIAQNGDIVFSGNSGNAVYIGGSSAKLTLKPESGNIIFNDGIYSVSGIEIMGSYGTVFFNKSLGGKTLYLYGGNIYLNPSQDWSASSVIANGGGFALADSSVNTIKLNNLVLNSDLHITPDINGSVMDSLNITSVTGSGFIKIDGFNIIDIDKEHPVTFIFMRGSGKERVCVPAVVYDDIYSYDTSYSSYDGSITIKPHKKEKRDTSVKAYNPVALMQAVLSYSAADSVQQMLNLHYDLRNLQNLSYDEPQSSFYVKPYYGYLKIKFINDGLVKNDNAGAGFGYFGGDLEQFDNLVLSGGLYFDLQSEKIEFSSLKSKQMQYALGGGVHLYSYHFFMGMTAQGGFLTMDNFAKGTVFNGGILGRAGLNIDLSADEMFLQPYGSYGLSYVGKGADFVNGSEVVKSEEFTLAEIRGAARLVKLYGEAWQGFIGGAYVKRNSGKQKFYTGNALLPVFEVKPFFQGEIGAVHKGKSVDFTLSVNATFGSVRRISSELTLNF